MIRVVRPAWIKITIVKDQVTNPLKRLLGSRIKGKRVIVQSRNLIKRIKIETIRIINMSKSGRERRTIRKVISRKSTGRVRSLTIMINSRINRNTINKRLERIIKKKKRIRIIIVKDTQNKRLNKKMIPNRRIQMITSPIRPWMTTTHPKRLPSKNHNL